MTQVNRERESRCPIAEYVRKGRWQCEFEFYDQSSIAGFCGGRTQEAWQFYRRFNMNARLLRLRYRPIASVLPWRFIP